MDGHQEQRPGGAGRWQSTQEESGASASYRAPGYSVESEFVLVGSMLSGAPMVQGLDASHFTDEAMRTAYSAAAAMAARGEAVDTVGVHLDIQQRGLGAACSLMDLQRAFDLATRPETLPAHASKNKEAHRLRKLSAIGISLAANPASAEQHLRDAEQLLDAGDTPPPFRVVTLDLDNDAEEEQRWFWRGYVPAGHVTLLSGHGGAGKSFVGLQTAACMAVGAPCLGRETASARVLYFSAEDPASLVRLRLRRICRRLCLDHRTVMDRLVVLDASDLEPVLFTERRIDGVTHGVTTATYSALQRFIDEHGIQVVIVDNASDAFDADEIKRALVRRFVRSLATLVRKHDGAVLLLSHVDKLTARAKAAGTDSYSGSTAWNNSVRSRLFLVEHEVGELELRHEKCNVGPKLPPLLVRWDRDDVMRVREVGGMVAAIQERNDSKTIIKLIHDFYLRAEWVATDTRSRYHAAKVLGDAPTYPKKTKAADIFRLITDAESRGLVKRESYKDHNRKTHERWALTAKGLETIGAAPSAPCAPSTEHGAPGHMAQRGAPSAPCSAQGVWGNRARTGNPAQEGI